MTGPALSSLWSTVAPAAANHLWQSTLVAAAAALLTLSLRKHHARARYWLWLAASLKFLVPFSWLVALGNRLSWSHAPAPSDPVLFVAMEEISRPFTQTAVNVTAAHAPSVVSASLPHLSTLLAAVWLGGLLTVFFVWISRWLRISAATRQARPLSDGREARTLRRMEQAFGVQKPIALLQSRVSLEPGIFGIVQPVLVWPEGISTHLDDDHLEAIIAHELWHVRRRDNLFAALHMLVEAVFWFYPLVWWLGARLIDERERACDEEVVALGKDRQVYAESILKVCEFCLGSPLPCVSGVTGADLKKRMVHIMNDRILHKLDFARRLLLTAVAFLAIAVPVTFGVFHATPSQAQTEAVSSATPVFESVSIKPDNSTTTGIYAKIMFSLNDGSFTARGVTLQKLIEMAYHLQENQTSGGPDWMNTAKFDIDAKLSSARVAEMKKAGPKGVRFDDQVFFKTLLSNYFRVSVHPETRNLAVYDLTVAEGGSKLQASDMGMFHLGKGELVSQGVPIELLANQLATRLGRTVVDRTGLKGTYAFNLHWTPDPGEDEREVQLGTAHSGGTSVSAPSADQAAPQILTAVQEQLGLKLEARTEPVPVMVVDHAEQPEQN